MMPRPTDDGDLIIRPAAPDDYEGICDVLEEVDALHREVLPHIFRKPDRAVRGREAIPVMGEPKMSLFVAEAAGSVVGVLRVRICESPPGPLMVPRCYATIDDLVVREGWRRRGVGRALMTWAEEWAREKGLEAIELGVWEFNADAICFYQQLGYTTLSRKLGKPLAGLVRQQQESAKKQTLG